MKKELTIYDIANALNMSASTVSRALNENKAININTRNKVMQYALENGYQSNTFAANLRQKETHTIGIIVPKIDSKFVSTCLAGAEKVASEKGYNLLISQSLDELRREESIAKTFFRKRVDGLMVSLTANTTDTKHFAPFIAKGIPLVFFDRTPELTDSACFIIDNYQAAYKASNHLLDQGCKCLIHLTLNSNNKVYWQRKKGFVQALHDANKTNCGETLFLKNLDLDAGKQAAVLIAKKSPRPDGVFAANDQTAVGCILAFQQMGIRVPDDIAVVGFNNDLVCEIVSPGLTSVNYPAFDLGAMAANQLIEHILGNSNLNVTNQTVLKSDIIIRGSSLKIKKQP
ncbi:MAG: LacI family transcriptional regulator [Bacteroidetes bacterium HGW-Bacteroidetes-4]|nr:MAG: LacI family transcriptional regulator [Bacteroidetes bacterium HGW-Bacteroidetes-4]